MSFVEIYEKRRSRLREDIDEFFILVEDKFRVDQDPEGEWYLISHHESFPSYKIQNIISEFKEKKFNTSHYNIHAVTMMAIRNACLIELLKLKNFSLDPSFKTFYNYNEEASVEISNAVFELLNYLRPDLKTEGETVVKFFNLISVKELTYNITLIDLVRALRIS